MKLRNAIVISVLVLLGIAGAGAVLSVYTDISVKAYANESAACLKYIPSDCQFVFGVNVQRFVQSPAYSSFRQTNPAAGDMALFVEKTGLNPARDISYLVGAANGKEKTTGIVIVSGVFNKDAIMSYLRSKSPVIEQSYAGTTVMMIQEEAADSVQKGFAFLDNQEIAMGDLDSLKASLDLRGRESGSILYNKTMEPLIRGIGPNPMLWFAGDAGALLSKAQASSPLASPLKNGSSNIKSIVGSINIGEALTGRITATAFTPEQAVKLADAMRGLIAVGQMAGSKNQDLQGLLRGLVVSQDSNQIRVDLNIPADILNKMSQRSPLQRMN